MDEEKTFFNSAIFHNRQLKIAGFTCILFALLLLGGHEEELAFGFCVAGILALCFSDTKE